MPVRPVGSLRREAESYLRLRDANEGLPEDELIGRVVSFGVASGVAVYRVTSELPLRLEHLPSCGGYRLPEPVLRQLSRDDILARVQRDRRCQPDRATSQPS